jgi:uncharacterized protein involved in exopolysaccharide biosynthesis
MITRAFATGPSVHSTRNVFQVLARHQRKVVVFFCATVAAVVGALVVFPRTYSSEARLYVRLGYEGVSLDPTAAPGHLVVVSGSRETGIDSELEMLRSPVQLENLEDAVEHLGPNGILGGSAGRAKTWMGTLFSPLAVFNSF